MKEIDDSFKTETQEILQNIGKDKQMELEQINEMVQENQEKRENISKSKHFMLNSMT